MQKIIRSNLFMIVLLSLASQTCAMFVPVDKVTKQKNVSAHGIGKVLNDLEQTIKRDGVTDANRDEGSVSLTALETRIQKSNIKNKQPLFDQINARRAELGLPVASTPQESTKATEPVKTNQPEVTVVNSDPAKKTQENQNVDQNGKTGSENTPEDQQQKSDENKEKSDEQNKPADVSKFAQYLTKKNIFFGALGFTAAATIGCVGRQLYTIDVVAHNNKYYVDLIEFLDNQPDRAIFNTQDFQDLIDAIKVLHEEEKEYLINRAMLGEKNELLRFLTTNKDDILARVEELSSWQKFKMKLGILSDKWTTKASSMSEGMKSWFLGDEEDEQVA